MSQQRSITDFFAKRKKPPTPPRAALVAKTNRSPKPQPTPEPQTEPTRVSASNDEASPLTSPPPPKRIKRRISETPRSDDSGDDDWNPDGASPVRRPMDRLRRNDDASSDEDGRPRRSIRARRRSSLLSAPSTTIQNDDLAMMCARQVKAPLKVLLYDVELVPRARRTLEGSVLQKVSDRQKWAQDLPELVALCGEAAWRCSARLNASRPATKHDPKPLMLEYLCDRLDVDDPLWGYQLRTQDTGWLQGFVTVTTFTTWAPYLRFDSYAAAAGITADDVRDRRVDVENRLGALLEAQPRRGDPEAEGIIFPSVAEISLLGGLGGGAAVLSIALDELPQAYEFVVLQATEIGIPFYEALGFTRVGVVAQHATSTNCTILAPEKGKEPHASKVYRLRKNLRQLLRDLAKHDVSKVFQTAVDTALVTDYLDVVKEPMDHSLLRTKLIAGEYASLASFVQDHDLVWRNCTLYNPEGNPWHAAALLYRDRCARVIERWRLQHSDLATFDGSTKSYTDEELAKAADTDEDVMGLCVWSFPDTNVEDQYPCYLMALDLKERRGQQRKSGFAGLFQRRASGEEKAESVESILARRRQASETWLPDWPRGVVPRGRGLAAKFVAGGNSNYLGYFDERDWASQAYDDAKSKYEHEIKAAPPVPSLEGAEWLQTLRSKRATLLAAAPAPPPASRRARHGEAHLASSQANDKLVAAARHRFKPTSKLYEQIVVIEDGVAPDYWFVHQYVPDCAWCRLVKLAACGKFDRGKRAGRTRWKLVAEGTQRDLDISAKRCVVIRSKMTADTDDADDEVWDVEDPRKGLLNDLFRSRR